MKNEILRFIPEFELIRDAGLRDKSLAVWDDALSESSLTLEDLLSMPFTLLAENVRISFLEHVRTVCRMCVAVCDVLQQAYGDRASIRRDVLIAGALLADVGKLIEYEKRNGEFVRSEKGQYLRHPFSGVGMCYRRDLPPEVMHVVATHSKEGDIMTRTPESVIFHHADFIDFDLISKQRPF
ncbi:MAG: HDIG domain-containing protein [Acidobacteria bacterium]|nr:HDIG domain-containing protein [Acidobacteriota bacterium]